MEEILKSIFLGILQGLTEFLPVSSSGHLVLAEKLGISEPDMLFNVTVHVGTLLAVGVVYRKKLWELLVHPLKNKLWLYVVASLPTAALGLIFKKCFSEVLLGKYLPLGFMISAVVLTAGDLLKNNRNKGLNCKNAFLIGVSQGLAVFPGISRSGSTISAGMALGLDKTTAADFSFILGFPVILGSSALEFIDAVSSGKTVDFMSLSCGAAAAFVAGLVSLKFMLDFVKKHDFKPFIGYLVLLSAVSFLIL